MQSFTNYMQLALSQAFLAIGESRPNPAVGACVVKDGIVVGKGRTQRPGSAHAEVMALRDAGELARGAAIFVTLEPCCHYGRTPPCTKAIIDAGIKQVYFAHSDPNPVVRGNSRRILEDAGIEVFEGLEACIRATVDSAFLESVADASTECKVFGCSTQTSREEAEVEGHSVYAEIERYFEAYDYFVRNKRTFVEVKSAVSEEGFMGLVAADGSRQPLKITGEGANCWNHGLRAMSDAVLVGAGTLLADNPSLDVRYAEGNNPVKIVWAGHHEFTAQEVERSRILLEGLQNPSRVMVYSCVAQPVLGALNDVVLLSHSGFAENWGEMVADLSNRGMHRLMVEPGAGLASLLFAESGGAPGLPLWNRLDLWRSTDPKVEFLLDQGVESGKIREGLAFPDLPVQIIAKESAIIGMDVLTVYYHT